MYFSKIHVWKLSASTKLELGERRIESYQIIIFLYKGNQPIGDFGKSSVANHKQEREV